MNNLIKCSPMFILIFVAMAALCNGASARPRQVKSQPKAEALAGDAAAGAQMFQARCAVCHGQHGEGSALAPSLHGVVGSKAASTNFAGYTPALRASGIVWSPAKLSLFLAAPAKLAPGTAMAVSIPKAEDRTNLIAHLGSLTR